MGWDEDAFPVEIRYEVWYDEMSKRFVNYKAPKHLKRKRPAELRRSTATADIPNLIGGGGVSGDRSRSATMAASLVNVRNRRTRSPASNGRRLTTASSSTRHTHTDVSSDIRRQLLSDDEGDSRTRFNGTATLNRKAMSVLGGLDDTPRLQRRRSLSNAFNSSLSHASRINQIQQQQAPSSNSTLKRINKGLRKMASTLQRDTDEVPLNDFLGSVDRLASSTSRRLSPASHKLTKTQRRRSRGSRAKPTDTELYGGLSFTTQRSPIISSASGGGGGSSSSSSSRPKKVSPSSDGSRSDRVPSLDTDIDTDDSTLAANDGSDRDRATSQARKAAPKSNSSSRSSQAAGHLGVASARVHSVSASAPSTPRGGIRRGSSPTDEKKSTEDSSSASPMTVRREFSVKRLSTDSLNPASRTKTSPVFTDAVGGTVGRSRPPPPARQSTPELLGRRTASVDGGTPASSPAAPLLAPASAPTGASLPPPRPLSKSASSSPNAASRPSADLPGARPKLFTQASTPSRSPPVTHRSLSKHHKSISSIAFSPTGTDISLVRPQSKMTHPRSASKSTGKPRFSRRSTASVRSTAPASANGQARNLVPLTKYSRSKSPSPRSEHRRPIPPPPPRANTVANITGLGSGGGDASAASPKPDLTRPKGRSGRAPSSLSSTYSASKPRTKSPEYGPDDISLVRALSFEPSISSSSISSISESRKHSNSESRSISKSLSADAHIASRDSSSSRSTGTGGGSLAANADEGDMRERLPSSSFMSFSSMSTLSGIASSEAPRQSLSSAALADTPRTGGRGGDDEAQPSDFESDDEVAKDDDGEHQAALPDPFVTVDRGASRPVAADRRHSWSHSSDEASPTAGAGVGAASPSAIVNPKRKSVKNVRSFFENLLHERQPARSRSQRAPSRLSASNAGLISYYNSGSKSPQVASRRRHAKSYSHVAGNKHPYPRRPFALAGGEGEGDEPNDAEGSPRGRRLSRRQPSRTRVRRASSVAITVENIENGMFQLVHQHSSGSGSSGIGVGRPGGGSGSGSGSGPFGGVRRAARRSPFDDIRSAPSTLRPSSSSESLPPVPVVPDTFEFDPEIDFISSDDPKIFDWVRPPDESDSPATPKALSRAASVPPSNLVTPTPTSFDTTTRSALTASLLAAGLGGSNASGNPPVSSASALALASASPTSPHHRRNRNLSALPIGASLSAAFASHLCDPTTLARSAPVSPRSRALASPKDTTGPRSSFVRSRKKTVVSLQDIKSSRSKFASIKRMKTAASVAADLVAAGDDEPEIIVLRESKHAQKRLSDSRATSPRGRSHHRRRMTDKPLPALPGGLGLGGGGCYSAPSSPELTPRSPPMLTRRQVMARLVGGGSVSASVDSRGGGAVDELAPLPLPLASFPPLPSRPVPRIRGASSEPAAGARARMGQISRAMTYA